MKILTAPQIRELDAFSISSENISSWDLMERAAGVFVKRFIQLYSDKIPVKIFAGPGNNGGDGLAVGRMLSERAYPVEIFCFSSERHSTDYLINFQKLPETVKVNIINSEADLPALGQSDIVIDAIFGSGLTRPVTGLYSIVINHINRSGVKIVSVDIASGLFSENSLSVSTAIQPHITLSFQLPKLAFFLPENEKYTGNWEVLDIGLNANYIENTDTRFYYTTDLEIRNLLKKRSKFSHKGTFGKALMIAGSKGSVGAAVLSVKACCRSGAGVVYALVPGCANQILQITIPEAIVIPDPEDAFVSTLPELTKFDSVGIGPGIFEGKKTAEVLEQLFGEWNKPLVIDASALNVISANKALIKMIPAGSVLTPHPKEFERLTGVSGKDPKRLDVLSAFAEETRSVVLLKGAYTAIADPQGNIYFNSTGNPGMATAGSGDVLTGIITGLLAQGYDPINSAILGVYLHGFAGDSAVRKTGQGSLIASDIIEDIKVFYLHFEEV